MSKEEDAKAAREILVKVGLHVPEMRAFLGEALLQLNSIEETWAKNR